MRNFIMMLLVAVFMISTNAFASYGKTATKSVKMTEYKVATAIDATIVFSGESVKLPDRTLTNDVFIYSSNDISGGGAISLLSYFSLFGRSDNRQVLTPMQIIMIDRITRPRNPIAKINRTIDNFPNRFESSNYERHKILSKKHANVHLTRTMHK